MSVINQMLRDLQARGEPLPAQGFTPTRDGAAVANAISTASAHPTPFIATAPSKRQSDRVRRLCWGFTACAVLGVAIGWQWQTVQVRNARKLPLPLGYAEFKDAIDTRVNAVLPAAQAQTQPIAAPTAEPAATPVIAAAAPVMADVAVQPAAAVPPSPAPTVKPTAAQEPQRPPRTEQAAPKVVASIATPAATQPKPPAAAPTPTTTPTTVVRPSTNAAAQTDATLVRAAELIALGRNVEASAQLRQVLAAQPQHVDARRALAALQDEAGQRDAALATLLEGVQVDPVHFAPLAATLQVELGDGAGALATLDRVPTAAQTAQHHALVAGIAQRIGAHDEAAAAFNRALASDPQQPTWWLGLGLSLDALGRRADAQAAYEQATTLPSASAELREFAAQKLWARPAGRARN